MSTATPTALLQSWRSGDRGALDRLMPLLYDELSHVARGALSGERKDHTLQTRALVHEAYLRLIDANVEWQDRAHFFALAARAMRRVLVDHARSRRRIKRGGDPVRIELDDLPTPADARIDYLELDQALDRLAVLDERRARLIEMHFYAGLNYEETAEALGVSVATVGRELRLAKAWLSRELGVKPA
jgi:RNA polymerase sigma factor (TIGR02999 family)